MKEHDEIGKLAKFGGKMPKIVRNIALQTFAMFFLAVMVNFFKLNRLKISVETQIVR